MEQNKVTVYVSGEKFTLISDQDEKNVKETAEKVDTKIKSIQMGNPTIKKEKAIILACLDYCDDERRLLKECESLRLQMKEYLISMENERKKCELQKTEIDTLKQQILNLQNQKGEIEKDNKKAVVAVGKVQNNKKSDLLDGAVQQSLF
ncbi:MAG: cell division protein ZapA [Acutalibacteraceae bacterium]